MEKEKKGGGQEGLAIKRFWKIGGRQQNPRRYIRSKQWKKKRMLSSLYIMILMPLNTQLRKFIHEFVVTNKDPGQPHIPRYKRSTWEMFPK